MIVIGSGVIGLSCAWMLARRGVRVRVLERGDIPGASTASLGVLAPSTPLGRSNFHDFHRTSLSLFERFALELEKDSGVPVHYHRCGSLEVLFSESQHVQAGKEVTVARESGWMIDRLPVLELLSPEDVRETEPAVTSTQFGALYNRMTASVSVKHLLRALRTACQTCGVEICENCKVNRILISNEQIRGVETATGILGCNVLLVCAGAWTSRLHTLLDTFAQVKPVGGQALLVKAQAHSLKSIVQGNKKWVVPRDKDLILLGSTTERDSGFDVQVTTDGIREILDSSTQAVPALRDASLKTAWAGLRPAGRDGKPYLGPVPGAEGLFVAAGHYKVGFGLAPLTARVMADLITEGKTSIDLSGLAPRKTRRSKQDKNG